MTSLVKMATEEEPNKVLPEKDMLDKITDCKRERAPYLVVDYGDQLVADIADVRDELHKEILSTIERLHLLWEVTRAFMLFIITVVGGITSAVILQMVFPRYVAEFCFTSCIGITLVVGYLTLNPLMEAVSRYNRHTFYTPNFINCLCEVCSDREQKRAGDDLQDGDKAVLKCEPTSEEAESKPESAALDGFEQVKSTETVASNE